MQNAMFKYPSDIFERDWSVIACALQVILFPSKNNTLRVSQKRKKKPNKEKNHMHYFSATSDVSS